MDSSMSMDDHFVIELTPIANNYPPAVSYFVEKNGEGDDQLWATDGTVLGTRVVASFGEGTSTTHHDWRPRFFGVAG